MNKKKQNRRMCHIFRQNMEETMTKSVSNNNLKMSQKVTDCPFPFMVSGSIMLQ